MHLESRKLQHFSELRRGAHHNKPLQAAFNKYGESAFVFEVLYQTATYEEARRLEGEILQEYFGDSLFNTTNQNAGFMPGNPSKKGIPCSEATKAKIGAANRGRKHTEESRRKISAALMGNTFTKGKKKSAEAVARMRVTGKQPNAGHYKVTTWYCKDGVVYAGSNAASLATGVPRTTLMKHALRGKNGWSVQKPPAVATPVPDNK